MQATQLLVNALDLVRDTVHSAVDGLDEEALSTRLDTEANTIGWLVWHLTRVQDDHVADVAGSGQVWAEQGWAERFGLPFDEASTGYGHGNAEVAAVRVSAELLAGYHDAVHDASVAYLRSLGEEDLDRIIDEAWDPPVTLGVRLLSVCNDDLQHAGQAAFVRGVVERST